MLSQQQMQEIESRLADAAIRNMNRLGCSQQEAMEGTLRWFAKEYPEVAAAYTMTKEASA